MQKRQFKGVFFYFSAKTRQKTKAGLSQLYIIQKLINHLTFARFFHDKLL